MTTPLLRLFVIPVLGLVLPQAVRASAFNSSLNASAGQAGYSGTLAGLTVPQIIGQSIGYLLSFIGVIFLVLTILAGYKWMMSGGNESTISEAKNSLMHAVVGLIIVLSAYAIVKLFQQFAF